MYVILSGTAVVTKTRSSAHSLTMTRQGRLEGIGEDNEEEVMQLEEECYFGERALLDNTPRYRPP